MDLPTEGRSPLFAVIKELLIVLLSFDESLLEQVGICA
jgi:hypothetical protein